MSDNYSVNLSTPISHLYLVGPTFAGRLAKLRINTVEDLINHYPFRYDDFSLISKISRVQPGETVTIRGTVESIKNIFTKNNKKIQQAVIADETGNLNVIWFNQPFLINTLKIGETLNLSGKVGFFSRKLVLYSPEYEIIKAQNIHTGRLVPVYPETYGISSKWLRSRIAPLLPVILSQIKDYLPKDLLLKNNLIPLNFALEKIHFPDTKAEAEKAKERLSFDELFFIQLKSLTRKKEWQQKVVGNPFKISDYKEKINFFWEKLPFALTNAQKRVVGEIFGDLAKTTPMNRLLEGDVGSGKTVVAAICLYLSYLNGYQSAFMAPTEILANQHFQTIKQLLEPLGLKIGLFTSTTNNDNTPIRQCANSLIDIYIGTHSLIADKIKFNNLGLIVIDEQHRFGVEQRTKLIQKGKNPHLLTMTATPIPRTVALTLYRELDLSVLDEMPKERMPIKTWVVPKDKRKGAYNWISQQIADYSSQAFIICPLIEESKTPDQTLFGETLQTVKSAKKEFIVLQKDVFPDLKLGLLHGKLSGKEKEKILTKFRENKIQILVATPVVEVGIDVPNATVMLIEGADRFGLAQLHQLRGRVGRGNKQAYCLLFTESDSPKVHHRLKSLETLHVGIELAELDLRLRGPGEIYGLRQHGLPDLKIASLSNLTLVEMSKAAAEEILQKNPAFASNLLDKEKDSSDNNNPSSPN